MYNNNYNDFLFICLYFYYNLIYSILFSSPIELTKNKHSCKLHYKKRHIFKIKIKLYVAKLHF